MISKMLIALIRVYQFAISPLLGQRCRYYPSCSSYAVEALREQGALRGMGLASWRLLRCNPFSNGGYDPVPPRHKGCEHEHCEANLNAHV